MRLANGPVWLLLLALPLSAPVLAKSPSCAPVPGLDDLIEPGGVLLLGEMHGTEQSPAFLATVVCHALARKLPVTVGLEIFRSEAPRIDAYLASDGGPKSEAALLASDFWTRDYQDGRSSQAMLGLLRTLRQSVAAGATLRVVPLDDPSKPGDGRDRVMAETLAAARAEHPGGLLVSLTGNVHNRLARGWGGDDDYQPMGLRLEKLAAAWRPPATVVSLNVAYTGGSSWMCFDGNASACGPKGLNGRPGPTVGVALAGDGKPSSGAGAKPSEAAYSGRYYVGKLSPSPPAVSRSGPSS